MKNIVRKNMKKISVWIFLIALFLFFGAYLMSDFSDSHKAVVGARPEARILVKVNSALIRKDKKNFVRFKYQGVNLDIPQALYDSCGGGTRFCFRWPDMGGSITYRDDYQVVVLEIPIDFELSKSLYPPSLTVMHDIFDDMGGYGENHDYPGYIYYESRKKKDKVFYLIPADKAMLTPMGLPFLIACEKNFSKVDGQPGIWISTHKGPICQASISYPDGMSVKATFYADLLKEKRRFLVELTEYFNSFRGV
jgi:hypothetical protein